MKPGLKVAGNTDTNALSLPAKSSNVSGGTADTDFQPVLMREVWRGQATGRILHNHSITFQEHYTTRSFEELRVADYEEGRRDGDGGQTGKSGDVNMGGTEN